MVSHPNRSPLPAPEPRDLVQGVLDDLRRIVQAIRVSAVRSRSAGSLSAAQLFVLHQLAAHPGQSLNELAAGTRTDQSSVSVVVRRLVAQQLVHRRSSERDGRRLELTLTPAGRRVVERAPEPTQARLIAALEGLRSRELEGLSRGLEAMVRAMDLSPGTPPMFFEEVGAPPARRRKPDHAGP